ncbi:MAG TPA: hypothetical protein VK588_10285 [Chitinophagaceae bacterium]|nr:hypothetical protein [Chitinophagaceae bacterium]
MPKTKDQKSVFDLTDEEEEERLQAVTDRLRQEIYAKGLPIVYQDDRCPTDNHYIERYEDGRTALVLFDINTRKYIPVKELPKD